MPVRRETDHLGAFNFLVEIEGIETGGFRSVRGLSGEIDVVEFRDGADQFVQKVPGVARFGDIVLEHGYVGTTELLEWWESIRQGGGDRRSMSIVLLDEARNEVRRWNCFGCWPRRWELSPLEGVASRALFESITIVVERIAMG